MGDARIAVPRHVGVADGFSGLTARRVALTGFSDAAGTGVLPGRIGERTTVGNIGMGTITLDPPPGALLRDAIAADLTAAGHSVVAAGDPGVPTLNGQSVRFTITTPATALYWDVTIDSALSVRAGTGASALTQTFTAQCKERTYAFPGDALIARVAAHCVDDLAGQVRGSAAIVQALDAP